LKTLPRRFTIGAMNGSMHAGIAALALLLTMFAAAAEERPHVTAEQVATAVAALDALAAKQNAVPGFAIAVVFQDKAVYAKGFGAGKRRGSRKKSSPAKSEQPSNKSAGSNRPVTKVILSACCAESHAC
jgi:ribosomal protein L44E